MARGKDEQLWRHTSLIAWVTHHYAGFGKRKRVPPDYYNMSKASEHKVTDLDFERMIASQVDRGAPEYVYDTKAGILKKVETNGT